MCVTAIRTEQLVADRADHLEHGRDARELFGHVLAKQLHGRRASGAGRIRFELDLFTRQVRQQGLACAGFVDRRCRRLVSLTSRLEGPSSGRQVFQLRFELIDLPRQLLGLAPEVHSPELVDLRLQALNLVVPSSDLPHHVRDRCLLFEQRCLLREHQGLELGNSIGKRLVIGHASQFTSPRCGLQH